MGRKNGAAAPGVEGRAWEKATVALETAATPVRAAEAEQAARTEAPAIEATVGRTGARRLRTTRGTTA